MSNTNRTYSTPAMIHDEAAYQAAIERRIKMNRVKGNQARWLAESPTAQTCIDFLEACGQFAATDITDYDGAFIARRAHPVVVASYGDFYSKMQDSFMDWGRLTPGQERAVLGMIEKANARLAARAEAKAADAATSKHVGTIGERRDFDLTCLFRTSFEGSFGYVHIHGFKDADGNTVIYKGSNIIAAKGDVVTLKATIKDHGERDGVAQTIISRPKVK